MEISENLGIFLCLCSLESNNRFQLDCFRKYLDLRKLYQSLGD